ncbi:MAG: signal recognition particle protein, partial [Pseudomonadota bacterium]
ERMMKRFQKGQFNMNDLRMQLEQMMKMVCMEGMMYIMTGVCKIKGQMAEACIDDKMLKRQIALIQSMTKKERAAPQILQASRKKRIAAGAGLEVQELNRLLKQHRQMSDMMKKLGRNGGKGLMKQLGGMFGMGGKGPTEAEIAAAQAQMGKVGAMPRGAGAGGLPGLGGGQQLPPGLSGFGKKK